MMTGKYKEHYKNNNTCQFCEKKNKFDKVRDHCHSTGKYRGSAQKKCNTNVTQK